MLCFVKVCVTNFENEGGHYGGFFARTSRMSVYRRRRLQRKKPKDSLVISGEGGLGRLFLWKEKIKIEYRAMRLLALINRLKLFWVVSRLDGRP